jgi:hypothetical protein
MAASAEDERLGLSLFGWVVAFGEMGAFFPLW